MGETSIAAQTGIASPLSHKALAGFRSTEQMWGIAL
jgi:hypothetical protein